MKLPVENYLRQKKKDRFKFVQLAKKILDNVILKMDTPNCFGIYGNWGSGKSTLINFIKDEILSSKKKVYRDLQVVYFEPWKYEYSGQNDLLFALLGKIKNELGTDSVTWKNLAKLGLTIGAWGIKHVPGIVGLRLDPGEIKETGEMIEKMLFDEHERWVNSVETLKIKFNDVVKKGLEKYNKRRLIIFIDDLDRCLPDNSVKLLEAIKNFLCIENTIFVIAIDKRVVSQMIGKKYNLYPQYGDEYLMKIIHYYYDLPDQNLRDMVKETLGDFGLELKDQTIFYIADFLKSFGGELRKTKHYLYNFCVKIGLSDTMLNENDNDEIQVRMLFVASFILSKFPYLFSKGDLKLKLINILHSAQLSSKNESEKYNLLVAGDTSIPIEDRKVLEAIMRRPVLTHRENPPPDFIDVNQLYSECLRLK